MQLARGILLTVVATAVIILLVCAWGSTKDKQRRTEGFFAPGLTEQGRLHISTGCTVNVADGQDSYTFKSEAMQSDTKSSTRRSCVIADNSLGLLNPKEGDPCAVTNDDPENEWFNPFNKKPALVALTTQTVNGQQRCVAEISASITTDEIRRLDELMIKQGADVVSGAPKLRKDLKKALSDLETAMKNKKICDDELSVQSAQLAPLTAAIAMWVKKGSVGALTYVSVSGDRMCGLQADDRIQYSTDGGATWTPKGGLLKNVSIDGKKACGVNKEKEIFCVDDMDLLGNGSVKWQKMDGYLDNVSVSEGRMCGTNDKGDIWWAPFNKIGVWKKKDGVLKQISINGKRGCGVNASNEIFCTENIESPANDWVKIKPPDSRTLTQVSMDGGQLCGITSSGEIYCRDDSGSWAKKEGMLKQISLDGKGGKACGVGTDSMVYCSNKLDRDNDGVLWEGSQGYGAGDSVPAANVIDCASKCAGKEGDTCKSIYYDPDDKRCYRFKGRYGGSGDPWREAKPRGYTGNVAQLDRDRDGYIWTGSRGFGDDRTGDSLKANSAQECVNLCANKEGGSCKSMTFSSEMQHCWRNVDKYGLPNSTSRRNNDPQWSAWSTANVASNGVAAAPAPAAPAAAPPPAAWTKVGVEKFANVSVSDSILCGIKKDRSVRCSEDNGSTWVKKQGGLRDVSVDGKRLCGINDEGNLFCTYDFDKLSNDANMWAQLTTGWPMNNVSVSKTQMCATRNDNAVFCTGYNQRDWKQMPGLIKQVSLDGVAACGVNPNDQNIYCATDIGKGDWRQLPAAPEKLTQVSLKKNTVCGVGDSGAVFCKTNKDTGDAWVGYGGKAMKQVQVDTSGTRVCGVEMGGGKGEDADVFCFPLA